MTYRDEPLHEETDPLIGRASDGAAWSEATYAASATQLPPHHEREPHPDSSGEAIPWEEAPKRSHRPPNATLLIGLAVAGGIVLVIAIVWATFMRQDSSTGLSSGSDPFASSSKSAQPTSASSASASTPASTGRSGKPAAVADPDGAGQRCSEGFHVKGRKGFGTHSFRGSRETSCAFAAKVLEAYWEQVGMPTKDPKSITAAGSVSCRSTGAECSGNDFVMKCAAQNDEDWITCVGGKNARVYIY